MSRDFPFQVVVVFPPGMVDTADAAKLKAIAILAEAIPIPNGASLFVHRQDGNTVRTERFSMGMAKAMKTMQADGLPLARMPYQLHKSVQDIAGRLDVLAANPDAKPWELFGLNSLADACFELGVLAMYTHERINEELGATRTPGV